MVLPLPRETVIARHVLNVQTRDRALAVLDEFDSQAGETGKVGFRTRNLTLGSPSIHVSEKYTVGKRDLDHPGDNSPEFRLLHVSPYILRQNLGSDLYFGFRFVGSLAHPVLQVAGI